MDRELKDSRRVITNNNLIITKESDDNSYYISRVMEKISRIDYLQFFDWTSNGGYKESTYVHV